MATTTNFGWETPDDTDLVKDGALAMRTLGNSIDTSFVDLKGGTTGQVLSKTSNTDMDFTWINNDQGDITEVQAGTGISVASGTGPIPVVTNTVATTFDAKGDLVAGTGADTFAKLTVGANDTVLTADSTTATGLKWATPAAASFVGCRLLNSANQTISNNTWTAVTFNTETFDTDGFHSTTTNTSRVTIPSGKAGKYLLIGNASWNSANATGRRAMQIYKNGTALNGSRFENSPTANSFPNNAVSIIMDGTVGDYFEVFVIQTSGGNMDIYADDSSFHVQYLGA